MSNPVNSYTPDPNKPVLTLSATAAQYIKSYLAKQGDANLSMRVSVKESGCSGLKYHVDFTAESYPEDHAVYQQTHDLTIYIQQQALPYLRGTQLDYVSEGLNKRLVFNNPNATGQCGCGESFSVVE